MGAIRINDKLIFDAAYNLSGVPVNLHGVANVRSGSLAARVQIMHEPGIAPEHASIGAKELGEVTAFLNKSGFSEYKILLSPDVDYQVRIN